MKKFYFLLFNFLFITISFGQNVKRVIIDSSKETDLNFNKNKFRGSLQLRYLQDRPANEDNSIEAKGYSITDLNVSYRCKKYNFWNCYRKPI